MSMMIYHSQDMKRFTALPLLAMLALLAAGLAYAIGDTATMAVEAYQHQHPKVGVRVFCGLVANASELLYEKIKINGDA
jgi:uncharacterized membrane protein